jgi:hypothetical protein
MKSEHFILAIVLLFIFCSCCFAELIDGPANIRDNPNGKVIFSLDNNVEVDVSINIKDGWNRVGLWVYIDEMNVISKEHKIKKDTILYDSKNKKIGKLFEEVTWYGIDTEYDKKNKRLGVFIDGYTYPGNISNDSKIEIIIEKMVDNSKNLDFKYFEKHIHEFKYYKWGENWNKEGHFSGYVYSEPYLDDMIAGSARIALIFYRNKLAGILHERPMKFSKYKDEPGKNNLIIIDNSLSSKLDEYCHTITMWAGQ